MPHAKGTKSAEYYSEFGWYRGLYFIRPFVFYIGTVFILQNYQREYRKEERNVRQNY